MTSYDVYVNDEHAFRIYVAEQLGKINTRLTRLEERTEILEADVKGLRNDVKTVRTEIKHVNDEQIAFNAKLDMLLWGTGIIIGAATLAVTIWSMFKPSRNEESLKPQPVPSPTVINIPQPDINAIARQVAEIYGLKPKH